MKVLFFLFFVAVFFFGGGGRGGGMEWCQGVKTFSLGNINTNTQT